MRPIQIYLFVVICSLILGYLLIDLLLTFSNKEPNTNLKVVVDSTDEYYKKTLDSTYIFEHSKIPKELKNK